MGEVPLYLMHGMRSFPDVTPRQRSCFPVAERIRQPLTAADRERNYLKGFDNFHLEKARNDQMLGLALRLRATSLDRG